MDEELIILENEINTKDIEQSVETEETIEIVEIENAEEIEIEVNEAVGWVGGDSTKHYSLYGRDEPDQHPIKAITGLREELNQIEALQTVYSDKKQQADYYIWRQDEEHPLPANPYGLFVSVYKNTDKIQICDGASDVFGVTVAEAAFVGNQEYAQAVDSIKTGRDGKYCLVVYSGLVDVRCETDVAVGDYIVSNTRGEAKKSDGDYGYLVTALGEINGIKCAIISLGASSMLTQKIANNVDDLSGRMSTAEYNITSVTNVANSAYALAKDAKENAEVNSEYLEEKIEEVLGEMGYTEDMLEDFDETITNARKDAELAKAIANNAVSEAKQMGNDAYASANEAIAAIKDMGAGSTSWAKRLDAYSVGEYSQGYGLTWEQAKSALPIGIVHVPTVIHTEIYVGVDNTYEQEFYIGYYYEWNGEKWSPSLSTAVNFSSVYINGSSQSPYWVVTDADVEYNGVVYTLGYLYKWETVAWSITGASVAENTLTRAVSAMHQTANELSMEITNARGDAASLDVRINENEATVQNLARWTGSEEGKYNIATTKVSADDEGASIALVVVKDGVDEELGGARIVLNDDEKGSYIAIEADNIVMTGTTTFVTPEDLGEDGTTEIYGGRIATHTITSDKISVKNLSALSANIGTVHTGLIQSKCDPKIWGSEEIEEDNDNNNDNDNDYDGYSEGLSYTLINNETEYEVSGIGTCADTNIQIPSSYNGKSVTSIASRAFENCNSLTGIIIPDSVTSIGDAAFLGCPIETAIIPTIAIKSILNNVLTTVILTSGTSIGDETFKGCNSLKSIVIGSSIETIGHSAFYYCFSLQSITISNGVISIGDDAFHSCISLENITIPDSVTSIGDYAFIDCRSLKSVTIGNGVTSIGENAFKICNQLKSVIFKEDSKLENIGDYAFRSCSSLKSIVIPNSVKSIGNYAFYKCSSLTIYCEAERDIYTTSEKYRWNYSKYPVYYYSPTHKEDHWYYGNGGLRIESTNFNVTNEGILSATHANIEGKITAESGKIGNCTINSDGSIISANEKFKVDASGNLRASNANIEGKITASEGEIGNLTINSTNNGYALYCYGDNDEVLYHLDKTGLFFGDNSEFVIGDVSFQTKITTDNDETIKLTTLTSTGAFLIQGNNGAEIRIQDIAGTKYSNYYASVGFNKVDEEEYKSFTIHFGLTVRDSESHYNTLIRNDNIEFKIKVGYWGFGGTVYTKTLTYTQTIYKGQTYYQNPISISVNFNDNEAFDGVYYVCLFDEQGYSRTVFQRNEWNEEEGIKRTDNSYYTIKSFSQNENREIIEFNGNLLPRWGNQYNLGSETRRWAWVYSHGLTTGNVYGAEARFQDIYSHDVLVHSSDKNLKNTILPLNEMHDNFFDTLKPISFKFNDGTSGRTHMGFIAQDLKQSILNSGFTTQDMAVYCEWEDDEGNIACGIRTDELISLCVHQIQKLKVRVAELENKLQTLQND